MNNKTSDKNVGNMTEVAFDELIDNFEVVAYLTEYGRKGIKYNVKKLQARIKELEEKLVEFNKQLHLDYVDENFIPRQVVKDEIDVHTNLIKTKTGNPTLDAHFRDRENYVIDVLRKILKKGEK